MARFVPIIIQVKGGEDANRVAQQVVNAFKDIDKAGDTTAKSTQQSTKVTGNAFKEIEQQAKTSASGSANAFRTHLGAEFFAQWGRDALRAVWQFSKDFVTQGVQLAQDYKNALLGVSSVAVFKGIGDQEAQNAAKNLKFVKAGIIDVGSGATALKNLLQAGFGLEQSVTLIERFSDAASFGKQAALGYGDAIRSATEGIKNQNSILVDNAGVTKNIEVMLKERGFTMQDLSDKQKGVNAREALYAGLLAETQAQLGDSDKLLNTYTGSVAAQDMAYQNLQRTIGENIISNAGWIESTKIVTEQITLQTESLKAENSESRRFASDTIKYAALVKANLIPFAGFMVQMFKGIGAGVTGVQFAIVGGIARMAQALSNSTQEVANKVVNTLIAAYNKITGISNAVTSKIGVGPTFEPLQSVPYQPVTAGSDLLQMMKSSFQLMLDSFAKAQSMAVEGRLARERVGLAIELAPLKQEEERRWGLGQQNPTLKRMDELSDAASKLKNDFKETGNAAKKKGKIDEENIREARLYFGELQAAYLKQFGSALPARWGGSDLHRRQGMDHRAAADIGLHPNSPQGQWVRGWLKEKGIDYRGFAERVVRPDGRVISSGPHIHFGAPSGRPFAKSEQGLTERELDEADKRLTSLDIARLQRPISMPAMEPKGIELPEILTLFRDQYYQPLEREEAMLASRREYFADEFIVTQRKMAVDLENVELDLALFRAQNADDQFAEQRRLLSTKGEELTLLQDISRVQDELATGPYNESLRIQLALLEDIADIRRRDEDAIKAQNRAQLELADATIVHGQQVRASVMQHLASQRTMTEAWSDGIVSAYDKVMSFLDRGIEKLTRGIPIITQLVSALVHQLTNRVFQRFLDMVFPPAGGGGGGGMLTAGGSRQPAGGGILGGIGSIVNRIFGGGGAVTGTPPFAGFTGSSGGAGWQAGAAAALPMGASPWNLIPGMGGGITAPTSLSSQIANQASMAAAVQQGGGGWGEMGRRLGFPGAAGSGSFLRGLGSSLGAMAPLLGLSLGAGLGGQSRFGQVLGAAGGALAGVGVAGAMGMLPMALAGIALPGLIFAAPLIVGAILLARNAQRRKDETTRNQMSLDTIGQLNALLGQARSMDLGQATAAFEQIRVSYFNGVNQIKDSKTKRIATDWWYKPEHPPQVTWAKIKDAVTAGQRARDIEKHLVPEFATGGIVPYRTSLFSMTTGLTPIRVTPGEAMFAPGSSFGTIVPGPFTGVDNVLTAARPGTRVVPRSQVSGARGFQHGGVVGGDGPMVLNLTVDGDDAAQIFVAKVLETVKSQDGRKIIVKTARSAAANRDL